MKKFISLFAIYSSLNFLLYIFFFSSLVLFENEQKNQIATTSTQLIRENYLFTDFRSVKKDLAKIKEENFSRIEVFDSSKKRIIDLRGEVNFLTMKITKKIWSDGKEQHLKGIFTYYYGINKFFYLALKPLLLSLLITLPIFLFVTKRIQKREKEKIEYEKSQALNRIALQISHDIRSPIATLQQILCNQSSFHEQEKELFSSALQRIADIAESHLKDSKKKSIEEKTIFELSPFLNKIIKEKELEYPDLEIKYNIENHWIEFSLNDLARILSNLINNSYESMSKDKKIIITSDENEKNVFIRIQDSGHGIPEAILTSIGVKEITSKKSGNGLGLIHAIETLKRWNASLEILQTTTSGTTIQLTFPKIEIKSYLIDNDELVCLTWEARAKANNIPFKYSTNKEDFFKEVYKAPKNSYLYIDSELGNNIKGEIIAQELYNQGFFNIYLTTGHDKEKFSHLTFLKAVLSKTPPF